MEAHVVLVREPVVFKANRRSIVAYSYHQRTAVHIEESCERPQYGMLHSRVNLVCVQIHSEC